MTTRELPAAEWGKLVGTELETAAPHLRPGIDQVMVVEDGEQIVATWAVIFSRHLHGLWIAPSHRGKASVARRLLAGMYRLIGVEPVFTSALSEDVRGLLEHVGAEKLPGDHYVVSFGG